MVLSKGKLRRPISASRRFIDVKSREIRKQKCRNGRSEGKLNKKSREKNLENYTVAIYSTSTLFFVEKNCENFAFLVKILE